MTKTGKLPSSNKFMDKRLTNGLKSPKCLRIIVWGKYSRILLSCPLNQEGHLTGLLISLLPSALCPVVEMADFVSLRQKSHLLSPIEEICSLALYLPFLPQVTIIRRNSMHMNGTGESLTKNPRPRAILLLSLGKATKKTQSISPNVHSP